MTTFSWQFPIVITSEGLTPQSTASLASQVQANALANSPGITQNLPGSLISDMEGTVVAALSVMDQQRVESVNSLTPYGCNVSMLSQLGKLYLGQSQPGLATNTSVNVVFSAPNNIGWVIPNGFLISDGTYTYQIQVGGVIGSSGNSSSITAIAVQAGSWSVPENTAFTAVSSVPTTVSIASITNPVTGSPAGTAETWGSFRARVLQAGLAACVATPRFIKTLIGALLGAQANLISVQSASGGLRIVVGGSADTYEIANAIFMAVANIATLQGSAVSSSRNVTVSLTDFPDTYGLLYVAAPVQTVTMSVTWNTTLSNFTGGGAFPSLVQQPLVDYLNGLGIGQVINVMEMNEIFQQAVEDVLDSQFLTRLVFDVYINSTLVNPASGTYAISGDPESSFYAQTTGITIQQG